MKEIIKDTFAGNFFGNFFHFIKNKDNNKNDTDFLDTFSKNIKKITVDNKKENKNHFKITEKEITEQGKVQGDDIILPELDIIKSKSDQDNASAKKDSEEYYKYKRNKFQNLSKDNKHEEEQKKAKKNVISQKERKLPKNVIKALNGEEISLPVFERENRMLKEIQKEKDSSRIAI